MPDTITLRVNGAERTVDVADGESLLSLLRDRLGLTGAKISCAEGACGACTVLVNGEPVRSCVTSAASVRGDVLTIEGLARDGELHPLQRAFLDAYAFQCGYCTPGMIMAAAGLLARNLDPDEATIVAAMQGNICRCGMYARIVRAIQQAAAELRSGAAQGGGL